ncbi:MAG TPA: TlpA disulfide reductase family protein [Bryobacteraceae bacterium]|nr:TlpA disulfide reductase family protein [Bryobacteraceae bacterium]
MRSRLVSGIADILAGLAAFVLFVVADSFLHVAADLREALVVLSLMYLAVGLLRGTGRPDNVWLKGLLVASGGTLVLLVLLWNQIFHSFLALFLLAANLFTVWGVRARRLWSHQSALKWGMILLAPVTALVLVVFTTIPTVATRVATRRTTLPAPIFSMTASGGGQITSAGLHGRVVVLSFWATWCPACRRELPELDRLYRRYRSNSNVSFWGVDVLGNGETVAIAKDFMQKAGYALPLAFGNEKSAEDLGGDGLPFLIIMDKLGRVRLVHNGYDRSEPLQSELSKVIEALLNEG